MDLLLQGMTRLLLTKIPFFKEIILSSFECEHCGYQDNSIQSAGRIQDKGVKFTLKVRNQTVGFDSQSGSFYLVPIFHPCVMYLTGLEPSSSEV